jgi:hypothetical protein
VIESKVATVYAIIRILQKSGAKIRFTYGNSAHGVEIVAGSLFSTVHRSDFAIKDEAQIVARVGQFTEPRT